MRLKKVKLDPEKQAQFIAQVKREQAQRQQGYREKALAILPHICARCGREFAGKDLRELTVHHKDVNPMNNPPDGSNWELLCTSCHDDEHQEGQRKDHYGGYATAGGQEESLGHNPFAGLKDLIKPEAGETESGK
ncbi:MAG: HNH nuclease family protein [Candidatus Hydrogenedentes bacterium]|nr:HNH nuclease family protein [Candidatus Hydrogenedentota bacterium]